MTNNTSMPAGSFSTFSESTNVKVLQVSTLCFGAYLYFIIDFFLRFPARIPGYGSLRPTVIMILIVSVLLFSQKDKLKGRADDPIFKVFIVLAIYLVVSLPLVEWPGSVIRGNAKDFVAAAVFLVFTAFIIDSPKRLKILLGVFVGCQLFRVLEPLYLYFRYGMSLGYHHMGGGEFAGRLRGAPADYINPNELGFVIVTIIPFLHYLLWPGRWYAKAAYLVLMPLLLYALVLTMSRGAFLALIVVGWMILKNSGKKFLVIAAFLAIAIVGWNSMSHLQQDRYRSIFDEEAAGHGTAQGRLEGMKSEFKLGLQRPVVGHGVGTTPEAKTHFFGKRQASHNLYAELLIEIGIIGAIIFFVFLKRIYDRFTSNRQKLRKLGLGQHHFYSRLNMALVAVFWMYAVYSFNYYGLSVYYWYLFAGIAIVFGRIMDFHLTEKNSLNDPKPAEA